MDRTYSTHGKDEKYTTKVYSENLKVRQHIEHRGINEERVLKRISIKWVYVCGKTRD